MSSTQTPPPPKTPLGCVDWWCGREFRCEDPSASLRFAQEDTPSVCMDRRLRRCHFAGQNDRAVREAGPYEFYRGCGGSPLSLCRWQRQLPSRGACRRLRRCCFAPQNNREGQAPPLHRRSTRHTATFSASGKYRLCLGFSSPHKGHSPLRGPHFQVQK